MKKIISLILLLLVNFTFAQNFLISGIIKDSIEPIPYATILIKGKNKGLITDINGEFSLPVKKYDTLLINYLGKKEYILKVDTISFVTIVLKEDPTIIETVLPYELYKPKNKDIIKPNSVVNEQQINLKRIYILGGIVSAITEKEINFSKKYGVQFYDFGCVHPENIEDYKRINCEIFNYLNKKFGKAWQKEINPIAIGFQDWIKNNN